MMAESLEPEQVEMTHPDEVSSEQDAPEEAQGEVQSILGEDLNMLERQAIRVANAPCTYLWVAFAISFGLGVLGLIVGEFAVEVEGAGWTSRGTLIADRHTQFILINQNREELWSDTTGLFWDDLTTNVQPGWESFDDDSVDDDGRRLMSSSREEKLVTVSMGQLLDGSRPLDVRRLLQSSESEPESKYRRLPFALTPEIKRKLQDTQNTGLMAGCNISWYDEEMLSDSRLWPIWHPSDYSEPKTLLSEDVLRDLCISEDITQQELIKNDLCYGCDDGCLPPYSIVLFARLTVPSGMTLGCEELAAAWTTYNSENPGLSQNLTDCSASLAARNPSETCPEHFSSIFVDELYSSSGDVAYTSSVFATRSTYDDIDEMYEMVSSFDKGTPLIEGAYDTQDEDFGYIFVDAALGSDMSLALGSAFITTIAILIHTKSPMLTGIGLLQIVLSFPLSYFFYALVFQLKFFPFLNFIGVFIVFALGADDVFVAVDKWKNARIEHGTKATTGEIAAIALPDAAGAMFLTTLTTAVAFFGTAICPVAPIRMFSIFVGLLIVMDYILCVVLVFPALCIYDKWRHRSNCCCRCWLCRGTIEVDEDESERKPSLIRRILTRYYDIMHAARYPLIVVVVAAFILTGIFAAKMALPTSSDVRLLDSSNEYEKNYEWRLNLLYDVIVRSSGSSAFVMWGVIAADTGDQNNPESFSQLVLDESFEPSKEDAQVYLRDFCDKFFATEWAAPLVEGDECPINVFEQWLQDQSNSAAPDQIYVDHCGGATGLPMAEADFDQCIYNWGQQAGEEFVLARNGKVEVMYFAFNSRVRFDSPYDELDAEWKALEAWMKEERSSGAAPASASGMYFTSEDYWWYDTNGRMLNTAYTASAIAISTGAAVILVSSRSFVLTIFSSFTIGYVLASVTAVLVSFGWSLGFLEAICFAILIGLSCDFVIHFSHAYASLKGDVAREERTKFALISMGPSILAAGITTIAAATVMLFTVISFFFKFGMILFVTVVQATLGSFVVFLVLTDTMGPSEPTRLIDSLIKKCRGSGDEPEANENGTPTKR